MAKARGFWENRAMNSFRYRVGCVRLALAAWALAGALPNGASAVSAPATPVTIRLATYNVRSYFSDNRLVDGVYLHDWPKPEDEKTALRAVIRAAHPDVLAMEEMGLAPYLEELQRDLATEGLKYPYSTLVNGPDPDRHVAVLSRLPLAEVDAHADIPYQLGKGTSQVHRGLLEVHFVTAGVPWTLYVVHLKSKLTEVSFDPQSARERDAEAVAVRDVIRQRQPLTGAELVAVVGDFNDTRDSPPLKRFLELDGKPLLRAAPALDSRGEAWTLSYPRADTYDRCDFILLSAALAPAQKGGAVVDIPAATEASDHRMVWADLVFPPPPEAPAKTPAAKTASAGP
jgi:endonuclease/exonuclease/phosphatase family metal-dependent hydrolase